MQMSTLGSAQPAPLHVLMFDAYGSGGVARTVVNLANHLAARRQVEVISVFRRRELPRFPLDPRVRLSVLRDTRTEPSWLQARMERQPTRLRPEPAETEMNLLTDVLLRRKLRGLHGGVLLTTRPSLHLAAARWAGEHVIRVGQDHLNFPARYRNPQQVPVLGAALPKLDAFAVLTEADARDYTRALPTLNGRVHVIRNASPWPARPAPVESDSKVVVTASRLAPEKGLPRLLRAYEPVARKHPDWQLHIYGTGPEKTSLTKLVTERGLDEQVKLKGFSDDLQGVLADAEVYAMTSHREGFPMSLVEAMSTGLPPIAFDCPRGPAEIIDDGSNGRLLRDGDLDGFTEALLSLIEDTGLRRRLGAQALRDAAAYDIAGITEQWESLLDEVATARAV
jgi:glycosyltransferase involved in cell wall biosynthesis